MNYNKMTVRDVPLSGKKVLLRCDFNVPQDKTTGEITSDKRIVAALPTIRYLLDHGAAVIACSHLGKPEAKFDKWVKKQTEKGKDPATLTEEKWKKSLDKLTLAPVAKRLSELLGKDVIFAHDVVGEDAKAKAAALKGGEIMLLENTRFEAGETKNDPALAKAMADMADLYVSDAFGAVHRAHASTEGAVRKAGVAVAGPLMLAEMEADAFVFDAFSNPSAGEIEERLDAFVATVRKAHPSTPLIFIQTEVRETVNFNLQARKFESDKRAAAEAGIRRLMKDDRNIYFIDSRGMIGTDHLGTVDGSHPSDQGFMLSLIHI